MRLINIREILPDVREFITTPLEKNISFAPGQFASISIEDGNNPPCARAYSIASSPNDAPLFTFLIKKYPGGRGTTWLWTKQKENILQMTLPLGHFCLHDLPQKDLYFFATGTGIAPIRSMILFLQEQNFQKKITLFLGARSVEELFYHQEFQRQETTSSLFSYHPSLSRETPTWKGSFGRLTEIITHRTLDVNAQVYICGSNQMVTEMREQIDQKGIPVEQIFFEPFS